jgi:hypothetical protein
MKLVFTYNKCLLALILMLVFRVGYAQPKTDMTIRTIDTDAAKGRTYYFDAEAGNDNHQGQSASHPWRSCKNIRRLKLVAGDQLLLKRGSRFHEVLEISGQGQNGNIIRVDAYGNGNKPQLHAPDSSLYAVLLRNSSYLSISNLEIVNTGTQPMAGRTGIKIESSDYGVSQDITLFALDIRDVNGSRVKDEGGGSGILIESKGNKIPSKFDNLRIEHCTIKKCERNGMIWSANWDRSKWYPSTNVQVRYNSIEEVPGDGIVPIGCDGAVIEYNRMSKSPATLPDTEAAAGIWPWSCDNTLIQFNEVSDHKAPWDAQGFDSDYNCTNTTIQYNYSHDNEVGFVLICNSGESDARKNIGNTGTLVKYNVSIDDANRVRKTRIGIFSPTIHLAGPVQHTIITRNILLVGIKPRDSVDRSIITSDSWGGYADNTAFKENIFITPEVSSFRMLKSTNNRFEGNHYYGRFTANPADKRGKFLSDVSGFAKEKVSKVFSKKTIADGQDVVTYVDQEKIESLFALHF